MTTPSAVQIRCCDTSRRQILLRLRTRISEKVKQWRNWSDKGIVAPEDAFIVAINGCRIRPALGDTTPPYVVKAVFPFGPGVVIVDVAAAEAVDSYYDFKDRITKKSGENVQTDIFTDDSHREVSA